MNKRSPLCLRSDDPVRIINIVFILVLALVFIYSAVYSPEDYYPVSSNQQLVGVKSSLSTGLSRGFSCIVRLDFDRARDFNQYSGRIFMFFILQLIMRITALTILSIRNPVSKKFLLITDISVSIILFLYCFWPFIKETFISFNQSVNT